MPYFRERFLKGVDTVGNLTNGTLTPGFFVTEGVDMTTFRTKPRSYPGYSKVELVPDEIAEPYSYFENLEELKEKALKVRSPSMASGLMPDTGHSFKISKFTWEGTMVSLLVNDSSRSWPYIGPRLPAVSPELNPWQAPSFFSDIDARGAELFARAVPSPDMFNLAQFLGELREGLPRLIPDLLTKGRFFRSVGSDYLNVEFGWMPFISDLQNLVKVFLTAQSAISGEPQVIRRTRQGLSQNAGYFNDLGSTGPGFYPSNCPESLKFLLPTDRQYFQNSLPSYYYNTAGKNTVEWRYTESSIWFTGQFYVLPKVPYDSDSYLARAQALMSTDITPSVLWELAPWSWLVDWFLGIGKGLESIETAVNERVLAQYAYVMEKTTSRSTFHVPPAISAGYGWLSPASMPGGDSVFTTESYRRLRANPFGYRGTTARPLSGTQLGILGALALTKSK